MAFKSFLNKMGLVEDEVTTVAKPVAPAVRAVPTTSQPVYSTWTPSVAVAPAVDASIQEMLTQSLQENKLSGFDYMKFISAVEETRATGVPEDARFKMTFSTAKQLGVDKTNLLKSGQHYLDVLSQDEADFNTGTVDYEKNEVQAREAKITNIDSTMADFNKKLSDLNQDRMNLATELQQEKLKLESRKAAFRVTLESIRNTIKTNITKIDQYLQ